MVHRQVVAAIDHWQHALATTLNLTHYGESRIQHARKYDLRASYRLNSADAGEYHQAWLRDALLLSERCRISARKTGATSPFVGEKRLCVC